MYKSNNGKFKEGIIWWDTKIDPSVDVDVFFYIHDFGGIGNVEGDNSKFEGIIRFKKSFGGKEIILWKGVTPNGETGEEVYRKYWG